MENDKTNIHLRSNDVQDLIGKPPSWLVRYGSLLVLIIVAGILFFSYYIKYPDVVSSPILITTQTPPIPIVSKTNGKLSRLLVTDNQAVDSLEILGIIENTANYQDILLIDSILSKPNIVEGIVTINFDKTLQMGELQGDYSHFIESLEKIKLYNGADLKQFQIAKLSENTNYQTTLNNTYKKQLNNLFIELNMAQSKLRSDESLLNKGIISNREFQESQSKVTALYNQIESLKASISSGNISLLNLKQQQKEFINTDNSNELDKKMALVENVNNMKSKIQFWKNTYLLTASTKGYVSLGTIRNENQYIEAGKIIFSILKAKTDFAAKMNLLPTNAGKVKIGQTVLIKLDNYPYQEFGTLEATIKSISSVPVEGKYIIEAAIKNNGTTSYNKKIEMQIDMLGQADIITSKKRLISKFFDRLSYVWHNKLK